MSNNKTLISMRIAPKSFIIILLSSSFFLTTTALYSNQQNDTLLQKKTVLAVRAEAAPKIDGLLDEDVWQKAVPACDFVIYNPYNGRASRNRTEVRVLYDDDALYIGAIMYDRSPDSIFVELGPRDADNLNADHFYVEISPFNDGLNGDVFKVSASGVQMDNKLQTSESFHHEDTWDAVWDSKTRITSEGWCAEIKIPYSALRFPRSPEQTWGINFWREVRRTRETSSWNYVSKEFGSTIAHMGVLKGIREIEPPLRLSLTPYLSGYLEKVNGEPGIGKSYNGGLDLKIGLSESFTLDATLIPDFGQVQSDDHVLNLTPFEIEYNEKRPFFMEGTELFNKGDIFYSRRIGGTPHLVNDVYNNLLPHEIVSYNPTEVSLINATKISGRLKNGLGIGVFNAVTEPMWAEVSDTLTKSVRRVKTEPLTNYNMIVFDQSLKNNSFVSMSNTNVIRAAAKDENYYTADVTNLSTLLQTNNKLYSVSGGTSLSQKYFKDSDARLGHSLDLSAGKTGGAFRTEYFFSMMSDSFDPNDMGYLRRNNEIEHAVEVSYNTFQPIGYLMTTRSSLSFGYSQLFEPRAFTSAEIGLDAMIVLMNYWSFSLEMMYAPRGENDYFEPRTEDMSMFYHVPEMLATAFRFDTDMSKKFYIQVESLYYKYWSDFNQKAYNVSVQPKYKVNRRLSFDYSLDYERNTNDIGFVDKNADDIIFGKRNISTIVNTLSGAFIFSPESYLTLRARHYWSRAVYDGDYFILQTDGSLQSDDTYTGVSDVNFNVFNVDMVYTWRFAPGSELSVVWKNSIESDGDVIINNAFDNLHDLFGMPQVNSISLKILYYLDYQVFKKMFSSK